MRETVIANVNTMLLVLFLKPPMQGLEQVDCDMMHT